MIYKCALLCTKSLNYRIANNINHGQNECCGHTYILDHKQYCREFHDVVFNLLKHGLGHLTLGCLIGQWQKIPKHSRTYCTVKYRVKLRQSLRFPHRPVTLTTLSVSVCACNTSWGRLCCKRSNVNKDNSFIY